jgi:uncharacterized protein YaaQ
LHPHRFEQFMADQTIQKLIAAVVQQQDEDLAVKALGDIQVPVFHLASAGGFLGRRNATLLIGLRGDDAVPVIQALQRSCRQRVEYLAVPLEGSPLPVPTSVPVTVGGSTVFTLPVERFVEF